MGYAVYVYNVPINVMPHQIPLEVMVTVGLDDDMFQEMGHYSILNRTRRL